MAADFIGKLWEYLAIFRLVFDLWFRWNWIIILVSIPKRNDILDENRFPAK